MINRTACIAAAIGTALLCQGTVGAAEAPAGAKSFRWVDSNGVVHYGDNVPPEYASQSLSELNRQGVKLREIPRQLSASEAATAQQAAAEAAKRRQHDSFLLSTYTLVHDIELLRDDRLSLIDGQMEIARVSINSINQRLGTLQERMRSFQPYSSAPGARRLPDKLAEEVVRTLKEQHGLQAALNSRESEKNALRAQFDADIARFRELTSRPAANQQPRLP